MAQDTRKLCINCAWRENCAKRFSLESGVMMHCPDYTEDIRLRKQRQEEHSPDNGKDGQ